MLTPHLLIILLAVVAILVIATRPAHGANPSIQNRTARTIVATWTCQDQLGVPRTHARSPWKHHSAGYRRAELARWQDRWRRCTYRLHERARQWNWQAWLPEKWRRVGVCETGLNWFHSWYRRDGSGYVSAFGIQAGAFDGAYDDDARRVGMPPWNDERPPSPWQQWKTALSHYARHGGFSGWGCRGA